MTEQFGLERKEHIWKTDRTFSSHIHHQENKTLIDRVSRLDISKDYLNAIMTLENLKDSA